MKFKVGDVVKCIDPNYNLELNKLYVIIDSYITGLNETAREFVKVANYDKNNRELTIKDYFSHRFILAEGHYNLALNKKEKNVLTAIISLADESIRDETINTIFIKLKAL